MTFDPASASLRARRQRRLGAIALAEQPMAVETNEEAARVLAQGVARLGIARWDDAARALRDSLRIAPDVAETHKLLGRACAEAKEHKDALVAYGRAVELEPKWADVHVAIAGVHEALGDDAAAVEAYRVALRSLVLVMLSALVVTSSNNLLGLSDILHGRARSWNIQLNRRFDLLESAKRAGDIQVDPLSVHPYSYISWEEVTADPSYWSNQCVSQYFGVNSVRVSGPSTSPPSD